MSSYLCRPTEIPRKYNLKLYTALASLLPGARLWSDQGYFMETGVFVTKRIELPKVGLSGHNLLAAVCTVFRSIWAIARTCWSDFTLLSGKIFVLMCQRFGFVKHLHRQSTAFGMRVKCSRHFLGHFAIELFFYRCLQNAPAMATPSYCPPSEGRPKFFGFMKGRIFDMQYLFSLQINGSRLLAKINSNPTRRPE